MGLKEAMKLILIDLNENLKSNNFGWPISSYGDHIMMWYQLINLQKNMHH